MLAETDISAVPAELIKHLLTLGLAFAGVWFANKRASRGTKESPITVEQPLDVRKHDAAAKASDVKRVEVEQAAIKAALDQVKAHFDNKLEIVKREITTAGQTRADSIMGKIDREIEAMRQNTEARVRELHEKINAVQVDSASHAAHIEDLKVRDHAHETQLLTLLKSGNKPR